MLPAGSGCARSLFVSPDQGLVFLLTLDFTDKIGNNILG